MSKIDPKRMCDHLLLTKKDNCKWGSLNAHVELNKFDQTLEKAVRIAERKMDNSQMQSGDEAYFIILEWL
jgi:hypothetical protein